MGKKTKVGKQRKDKYYKLAKETGLRSRSAFKLVQLNRKYQFLQRSQVLIDLCAAPGGWLQIAAQNMPMSSLIVGVDLVSISPMGNNIVTLQNDITKDSCRWELQKQLGTFQVDCVLHDGAPNVGKNWLHDAFSQAQLVLSALKLTTNFLKKGGWFITKVFRSKDYPALLAVFDKLFRKVHVTKPQASRNESAEIFVACQGYKKPAKVDPQLLDSKSVFKELQLDPDRQRINLAHPEKQKKKVQGYEEGDYTVYHPLNASAFIESDKYLELLSRANEIVMDNDKFKDLKATTPELKECFKDIQVLGRKELKLVLLWRKKALKWLEKEAEADAPPAESMPDSGGVAEVEGPDEQMDRELAEAKEDERRVERRKKHKEQRKKQQLKTKIDLQMVIPGDKPDVGGEDQELFNLMEIKRKRKVEELRAADRAAAVDAGEGEESDEDNYENEEGDEDAIYSDGEEVEEGIVVDEENALDRNTQRKRKTDIWFQREAFTNLDSDDDDDEEIENIIRRAKEEKGFAVTAKDEPTGSTEKQVKDEEIPDNDMEVVPSSSAPKTKVRLDPEGLALGTMLIHSSKTRRDLIDGGWNRYTFNDDNLPGWFMDDERKHFRKPLDVPPELVGEYGKKLKAIDARPIKRVAEAKARKKQRLIRKTEKARKRAEVVTENPELGEHEKVQELKRIYKKSGLLHKKKERKYLVAKKGQPMKRPRGLFKVVDPRLKKDTRADKAREQKKSGGRKKGANGRRKR